MKLLSQLHIKHKLIMINLFTTGIAFLLAGAVLLVHEYLSSRDAVLRNLTAQAKIVAGNNTAPLVFNDRKAAEESMGALKAIPNIECAVIYGKDGKVFADYCRPGLKKVALPQKPQGDGHYFAAGVLNVFQRIELDREMIGTIYIRSDLKQLHSLMVQYGAVAATTIAIAFGIAFVLLSRLQKMITEPIFDLSRVMQEVSRDRDYSLKANIASEDEIGSLARGFNGMLEQIQRRDLKLHVEIAERKRAEEEVRKLNEELELKVQERTRQLVEAQEALVHKEKLALLGLIAGGMGNELRNPLGVMSNAVFFLENVMPDADETVSEYLGIIRHEIGNSQRIISDLLDYYRIRTPQTRATTLRELVRQSIERCAIPENIRLEADLPELLPKILADPMQMGQVLRNLITNAVQAMPDGGALRIAACHRVRGSRFEVRGLEANNIEHRTSNVEPDADFIEISVEDTGTGIAPEHMDKLFQPLFSTKSRGIGLGLAFSKKLAEANGGRIEAESRLGEGTAFRLILLAEKAGR